MIVVLRSKEPKAWSGVNQYRNCHTDIATYWLKNGNKHTGLNDIDRERLEGILGFDLKPSSPYWKTFFIRNTGEDITLNTDVAIDELRYLFLVGSEGVTGHRLVQASLSEPKATADYIIVNEEEEAKVKNSVSKLKRKAFKEFDKLSATEVRKALRLYGMKAETMSAEQAENNLFDLVEESPENFIELWVNNKTRETQFLIESAISKNVVRRNKNSYYYGTDTIGYSMEDAIVFLEDRKNNDIKMAIKNGIEIK